MHRGRTTAPEAPPLCPCARKSCVNPLLNPGPLELRDRAEHAGDEPTARRAGVDPFAERDEGDAARLPLVEQQDEVTQVASEAIKAPAEDRLHFVPARVRRQLVERWPAVLRPAATVIDVLDGG